MKKEENVKSLVKKYERATIVGGLSYFVNKILFIAGVGMFLTVMPIKADNEAKFKNTTFYSENVVAAESEAFDKLKNQEISEKEYEKTLDYIASNQFTNELMKTCPDPSYAKREKHTMNCLWADLALLGGALVSCFAVMSATNKANEYEATLRIDYDYDVDKEIFGEFLDNNNKEDNEDYKEIFDI